MNTGGPTLQIYDDRMQKLEAITSRRYVIWVKNIAREMRRARCAQANGPPADVLQTPKALRDGLRHIGAQPDDTTLYAAVRDAHPHTAVGLFSWLKDHERSLLRLSPKAGSTMVAELVIEFGADAIRQACNAARPARRVRGRKMDHAGDQLVAAVIWVCQQCAYQVPPMDPATELKALTEIVRQTGALLTWKVTPRAMQKRLLKLQSDESAMRDAVVCNAFICIAAALYGADF